MNDTNTTAAAMRESEVESLRVELRAVTAERDAMRRMVRFVRTCCQEVIASTPVVFVPEYARGSQAEKQGGRELCAAILRDLSAPPQQDRANFADTMQCEFTRDGVKVEK